MISNKSFTLTETHSGIESDFYSIPNDYYAEYVHITQTRTRIPTPYFCTGQESESESKAESISLAIGTFSRYLSCRTLRRLES